MWLLSCLSLVDICLSIKKLQTGRLSLRISQDVNNYWPTSEQSKGWGISWVPAQPGGHSSTSTCSSHCKEPIRIERIKKHKVKAKPLTHLFPPILLPPCSDYCPLCQSYSHWPRTIISCRRLINSTQVVPKITQLIIQFIYSIKYSFHSYFGPTELLVLDMRFARALQPYTFNTHRESNSFLTGLIRIEGAIKQASGPFLCVSEEVACWQLELGLDSPAHWETEQSLRSSTCLTSFPFTVYFA